MSGSLASRLERLLLPLALAGTLAAQARTLSFYFFQDDYVPFGEAARNGTWEYLWRLLLARDLTPNWRVIPGLLYLASYKLFGMTPLPMHVVLLVLHLGTVALIYRLVARATGRTWAAFAAALIFSVHPAYAGTLGQVASVPHVAAAFFLAAGFNAVFECARADRPSSANAWWLCAVLSYVCALLSNESMAIMFPAFALALLLFDEQPERRTLRAAGRALPFALLGIAVALAVRTCNCTEASSVYSLDNAPRVFLIYAGRLLYPIGLESPYYIDPPHVYASVVLLAISGALLLRGSAIGRLGAIWMTLAIIPHIFVADHTASRFTYMATPGFAIAAAACAIACEPWLRRAHRALPALALTAVLAAVAPWYAWQTHLQNEPWRRTTADWRRLHDELQRTFPAVPPGARVEVIGGSLTHPLDNFYVMPALGWTIWNPSVTLQTFAPSDPYAAKIRASTNPYAAEFQNGQLIPLHKHP
jgi:Dolichyl-phosphate-mannose-protein mannosyltransferase